ncbi:hypothetical protein D918_06350 [Trichuris suis]|nr:hypothetical protein D918_06350 [Trichuris suis]
MSFVDFTKSPFTDLNREQTGQARSPLSTRSVTEVNTVCQNSVLDTDWSMVSMLRSMINLIHVPVSDNDEDNYYRERNSQYDYVVLSNWARYPVIVLAKDVDQFFANDYEFLKQDLRREGLYNQLTELLQTSSTADWSVCDAKHTLGNVAAQLLDKLFQRRRQVSD